MSCSGPATFGQGNTAVYLMALSAFPLSSFRISYNFNAPAPVVVQRPFDADTQQSARSISLPFAVLVRDALQLIPPKICARCMRSAFHCPRSGCPAIPFAPAPAAGVRGGGSRCSGSGCSRRVSETGLAKPCNST